MTGITQHIETELREQGVSLHLGERVEALLGEGRVTGVRTSHGEYEADIVVVCTGVKPNTEFLADTGIERLGNGAIKVDRQGAAR